MKSFIQVSLNGLRNYCQSRVVAFLTAVNQIKIAVAALELVQMLILNETLHDLHLHLITVMAF